MPYELKEIKEAKGYKRWKVCKKDDMERCFSKAPLTKTRAKSQMRAIYANENNPRGKLIVILTKEHKYPKEEVKNEVSKLNNQDVRKILKLLKNLN